MSFVTAQIKKPPNVKGIAMTVGIHVLVVAGVMSLPGIELPERVANVIIGSNIPLEQPDPIQPDENVKEPEVKLPTKAAITTPKPAIDLPKAPDITPTPFASGDAIVGFGDSGIEDRIIVEPLETITPTPDPVITGAALNARYSSQFQPSYPTAMVRMEQEGVVSVRVLVGTNGRAKQIELLSTPHPDFWNSTRKHALKKWRFKPATKDGKPYEAWISLKVKFELQA